MRIGCLLWILASVVAPSVHAANGPSAQAKLAYQAGAEEFEKTNFAEALSHFDRAFKLDPAPVLLYNIARCHEEMGAPEPAIRNFELYLARQPDAPDRVDVERRIRVMQAIVARGGKPRTEPSADRSLQWWGYGVAGAGVVGLALGGVWGSAAQSDAEAHRASRSPVEKGRLATAAEDGATRANISYVLGGALLATGVGLVVYDLMVDDVPVAVMPRVGGVDVQIRF